MEEVKLNMDRDDIEKLLKMPLAHVIDFLIRKNNKSKAERTGYLIDTDKHQIQIMTIRKSKSKSN